eukprot:1161054-Pelagomonas_calceolata.AAC.4
MGVGAKPPDSAGTPAASAAAPPPAAEVSPGAGAPTEVPLAPIPAQAAAVALEEGLGPGMGEPRRLATGGGTWV